MMKSAGHGKRPSGTEWVWCMGCLRAYRATEARRGGLCSYSNCDALMGELTIPWPEYQTNHPHYPAEPERGKEYPPNDGESFCLGISTF